MRERWMLLLGVLAGCTSLVPTDEGDASSTGAVSGSTGEGTRTAGVTSVNPTEPNPTESSANPVTTTPVTSAVTTDDGTTTIGVDVDTGDVDSSGVDTGILLDIGPMPPESVCLPPELYGPMLETHPGGWIAFAGCDPDTVILQTEGEPALISPDEVAMVSDVYGQALFGMPGAVATGVDLCCSSEMAWCLSVDVDAAELQLNESLAYASELFASLQSGCVGIRFQLVD